MSQIKTPGRDAGSVFEAAFGRRPEVVWSAPGRVNLLGEHTDYNAGLCLPMALSVGTDCAAAQNSSGMLRVVSGQRPGSIISVGIDSLSPSASWYDYVVGSVWALQRAGYVLDGLDLAVDSDVPEGAGLSSSAALECATVGAVAALTDTGLDGTSLAMLAHQCETGFVGVPCGVMDQMVSVLAQEGHALLLDANDGTWRQVPFDLQRWGLELLVLDTQAPHRLVDGGYAERRAQCHQAATALGIASLREAQLNQLGTLDPRLRRRARHVLTEIARVFEAVEILDQGSIDGLGRLMTASHESLRDDFEVTVPELDVAVEVALHSGALGARMTGGGFGGSVIALVPAGGVAVIAGAIEQAFEVRGWVEPRWLVGTASAGAREIAC